MAKVTGPLHSLSASGTICGTLTMLRQNGRNIAKKTSRPGGQPSTGQLAQRAAYRAAVAGWNGLDGPGKAAYKPAADAKRITPFNAYISAALSGAAPVGATIWDAGATTWDAGATAWD